MTKSMIGRSFSAISATLTALVSLVGCQSSPVVTMAYPPPSFNAPRMVAQQAVPMPAPVYHPVAATPRIASIPEKAVTAANPQMAGIPVAWVPPVAARPWRWIVIHHSATTTGGAAAFDKMHKAKGWDELGYDFVIGNGSDTANGQVEVGPRWTKQKIGAHAKSSDNRFNEYGIGICLVGNFDEERPTPQQLASLEKLSAYLMTTYHIRPEEVMGHKDTKSTDCPGKYLNVAAVRQAVAQMLTSKPYASKAVVPTELLTRVSSSQ